MPDQESLGRWDGLGSRDASSRSAAIEHIHQEVMRKVMAAPIPAPSPPASGSPPRSDLNNILAHLLMLSKRCPFDDVKERSAQLLQTVQEMEERLEEIEEGESFFASLSSAPQYTPSGILELC